MTVAPSLTEPHHFAVIPVSVARDPSLSDAAVRLYAAIDGRLVARESLRLRQDTLAEDLGWSLAKVKRAMRELTAAGLVESSRTSRSSRLALANPVRRPVDNPVSDRSDLTPHSECSLRSDPADSSDLTPPQINTPLSNKEQQHAAAAPATPTPAAVAADELTDRVGDYLAAITAATGLEITATKAVQRSLGRIRGQGLSAADLAALVAAYLATAGDRLDSPAGFVAGHVLPGIAAGSRPEAPPAPTPTPPPLEQTLTAERCDHGEIHGSCALCRRMLAEVRRIAAAVAPAATELRAVTEGQEVHLHAGLPDSPLRMEITATDHGRAVSSLELVLTDDAEPWLISPWAWWRLTASSDYGQRAGDPLEMDLTAAWLSSWNPERYPLTEADARWLVDIAPRLLAPARTVRERVALTVPPEADIDWEQGLAVVTLAGRVIAHVSVDEQAGEITGATLFTMPEHGRSASSMRAARQDAVALFRHLESPRIGVTIEPDEPDALAVILDPLSNGGRVDPELEPATLAGAFRALEHLDARTVRDAPRRLSPRREPSPERSPEQRAATPARGPVIPVPTREQLSALLADDPVPVGDPAEDPLEAALRELLESA